MVNKAYCVHVSQQHMVYQLRLQTEEEPKQRVITFGLMAQKKKNTSKRYDDGQNFFVGMWKESLMGKSSNSFHLFHGKMRQFYGETTKKGEN